MYES
jgi:low temperature requirement protein LtrA